MRKTITLTWNDAPEDSGRPPQLEIHSANVDSFEELDRVLRHAVKFIEIRLDVPEIHLRITSKARTQEDAG